MQKPTDSQRQARSAVFHTLGAREGTRRPIRRETLVTLAVVSFIAVLGITACSPDRDGVGRDAKDSPVGGSLDRIGVHRRSQLGHDRLASCVWADSEGRDRADCFWDLKDYGACAVGALMLSSGGPDGEDLLVAGVDELARPESLIAANRDLQLLWAKNLAPRVAVDWPDIDRPFTQWPVRALALMETGFGGGGPWIVVAAGDTEVYLARITVLQSDTGRVVTTFWHSGRIDGLLILPDFFGSEHPAIVAWGVNDKLGGFADQTAETHVPVSADGNALVQHERVPVVMILDPPAMMGMGPPYAAETALPQVKPFAYAFLNLAAGSGKQAGDASAEDKKLAAISQVRLRASGDDPAAEPMLEVVIHDARTPAQERATVLADARLRACSITLSNAETQMSAAESWHRNWFSSIRSAPFVQAESCDVARSSPSKGGAPQVNP